MYVILALALSPAWSLTIGRKQGLSLDANANGKDSNHGTTRNISLQVFQDRSMQIRNAEKADPWHAEADEEQRSLTNHTGKHDVMMRSTVDGHCMYNLPSTFNVDLMNSSSQRPKAPEFIAPRSPLMHGLHDTTQVALDRLFFDRMLVEAIEWRYPEDCLSFYVPYFASWEVAATNGVWADPNRAHVDADVATHLVHMGRFKKPAGIDHWLVLGRIAYVGGSAVKHPQFFNMQFLTPEAWYGTGYPPNQHAIPYPIWFRYDPSLDTNPGTDPIRVNWAASANGTATYNASAPAQGDPCGQAAAMKAVAAHCDGQWSCGLHVSDGMEVVPNCATGQIYGTFSCGAAPAEYEFFTRSFWSDQVLSLGCGKGPCWLWGRCEKSLSSFNPVVFIGSAKASETARVHALRQCHDRYWHCAQLNTGNRLFSTSTVAPYIEDLDSALLGSVFCINPPGDSPTRKGIFDSLAAGCIPVLFAEQSLSYHVWHIPKWQEVSVFVPLTDLAQPNFNLIDHLMEIPPEQIKAKQAAIARLAYSLQYSWQPAPSEWGLHNPARRDDAFMVSLRSLAATIR